MNHTEATQHIKATLAAFGPSEAINLTQDTWARLHEAMSVLIEQPEQEPVAFVKGCNRGQWEIFPAKAHQIFGIEQPLYTTPPQRTWVGLTDEEYAELAEEFGPFPINQIEAKLKKKNT